MMALPSGPKSCGSSTADNIDIGRVNYGFDYDYDVLEKQQMLIYIQYEVAIKIASLYS